MTPDFAKELEDAMEHNDRKAAPVFTAIQGKTTAAPATAEYDPMDVDRLIDIGRQRLDHARAVLNEIETEHQLKRTEALEKFRVEADDLKEKTRRLIDNLDAEYERRKQPAQKMIAIVSKLSEGKGHDW